MIGKQGASRSYGDDTHPRKRQRKEKDRNSEGTKQAHEKQVHEQSTGRVDKEMHPSSTSTHVTPLHSEVPPSYDFDNLYVPDIDDRATIPEKKNTSVEEAESNSSSSEAEFDPFAQSEEETEEDGPAGTQDDHVVEESDSKSAAVETIDSTKLPVQENEAIQQNALANGCEEETPNARVQRSSKLEGGSTGKVFIAEQIANTKVLRASMKTAKEQLAEKDVRIAELEKIVEGQQKASAKKESARMKLICAESAQKSDRIAQLEKLVEQQKNFEASAKKESARMKLVCEESAQKSDRIAQLEKIVEQQKNFEVSAKKESARMKLVCVKSAQKSDRIAQLEKIVEQQKNFEASAKKESARMKLVCEESAQKSDRIAQLEKLVEDQRKDIEDKEGENNMLRDNLSSREKDLEEQRQTLTTKEEDLKNVIWQRNEIHRTWAILEARMKKLNEAFSWQPDMEDKKGKAE